MTVTINVDHAITTTKCTLNQTNYTVLVTATGDRTITTALADDLILLNGADNLTIQPGAGNSLTFSNTSSAGNAACVTLNSSANNNIINNVSLSGSTQGVFSNGVLNIRGNSDGNKIQNCKITGPPAARPRNCIVLEGSSTAATNDNTEITGCEISRFFVAGNYGEGIFSYRYNKATIISGNHFFQPESTTVTVAGTTLRCLDIQDGYHDPAATVTVSGNFFGGSAPSCGGSAWMMSSANNIILTQAMWVHGGTNAGAGASIQGNTVQNFDLTCMQTGTGSWNVFDGIFVNGGRASIGTTSANTFGSEIGQNSIKNYVFLNGTGNSFVTGINVGSTAAVSVANNKIGSYTIDRSTTGTGILKFLGIYAYGTDLCTMTGNYLGSPTTANSVTTGFANDKMSIQALGCENASCTISNNTVKNLTNNAGWEIIGIISGHTSTAKTFTCQNNNISNLTAGDGADNDVTGIAVVVFNTNLAYTPQISGNTITNLFAASLCDAGTDVVGIGIGQNNANIRASGYCNNNTVTNLSDQTSDGNSFMAGITAYTQFGGDFSFSQNTVTNLDSKVIDTYGMRVFDDKLPSTGTVTFSQNTISDIETSQPGGLQYPTGLLILGKNIVASRNKIWSLRAVNAPSGSKIQGIQAIGDANSFYSIQNNMVSLGADQTGQVDIFGIFNNTFGAIADLDIFYNTICIAGSSAGQSACLDRRTASNVSSTIRNNIFYNARPGGLAVSNTNVPPESGWTSAASNRNYFVSPSAGSLCKWGASTVDMTGWQGASGGDAASVTRVIGPLGNQTLPEELFVNHPVADLGFITANNNECAVVQNIGEVVAGITVDYFGTARTATPDIGGFEFATVLPLEWVGFQAVALETANRLLWKTASESGVSHFEIERSPDGLFFEKIGEAAATGGNFEKGYTFDDARFLGKNWYRIRSVDRDGQSQTSPVAFLARPNSAQIPPAIFPNPTADGAVSLSFFSEMEGEVLLRICAASGRVLRTDAVILEKGQNVVPLDFSGLPKGVFELFVFQKTGSAAVRFVRI